ncbi:MULTISPECIES: FAD binding domain-containing protein [Methylobacterium]|uniref:Xanthine dehydrogenase family protein subunit M n=1 Tax=Methylobacterium longum TaxID=767694 RepID=A0ABT8AVA0_9HYPH|nr:MULTISPECIES: xanthine dehydrogenase family protein subunit M [Methylobacterium]MCJ2102914.1 xanthine dehydrogenase family protein subunit M [Methylobacterium sp. E-046]MDN3573416.1 xanthine dehydrogenase family protein subunit M [Methylobacterium longum]GJE12856.1 Aldehyde oxidoreductase FAD-binding subunit PaoB [Methylobacterium longum]
MRRFDYIRPASVPEAVAAGQHPGTAYLAAGTNLVDLMKGGVATPERVVDITRLPGLSAIERLPDGTTRVGALVRNSDLAHDPAFAKDYPMVAEALLAGASAQLRNAATVGGNLMQRTRCPYFTDAVSPCNKRAPGSGCAALGHATRIHAVQGWSAHCIATHPSDFCVPLAAFDAVVEIAGPDGDRAVPLTDFHRLPGDHPERETDLRPGELITALRLPPEAADFRAHARYLKVRDRTSYAFAVVSAAAALTLEGGRIGRARLALGGLALKPWRVAEAEAALAGQAPSPEAYAKAADAALAGAEPTGAANAFKIELARRVAVRALTQAAAGTPARIPALPASPFGIV